MSSSKADASFSRKSQSNKSANGKHDEKHHPSPTPISGAHHNRVEAEMAKQGDDQNSRSSALLDEDESTLGSRKGIPEELEYAKRYEKSRNESAGGWKRWFSRSKVVEASTKPSKQSFWNSTIGRLTQLGSFVAAVVGAWYVVTEANENPSWWYESSTKAPYVISPSGRKLAYAEYGNPLGKQVVLVFHDYLAGRGELDGLGLSEILKDTKKWSNVRVICIDRPGYGQSDRQRRRRLSDWHEDVMTVVNGLKIDQFSIIGIGAGGLYALSCAERIPGASPGRLVNVALLGSEAPRIDHFGLPIPTTPNDQKREAIIQKMLVGASWSGPLMLRLANITLYSSHNPSGVFALIYGPETKMLEARPNAYRAMVLSCREAWSQGFRNIQTELGATKDRSSASSSISTFSHIQLAKGAHIEMWHGDKDTLVPLPMAQHLAKSIPGTKIHVCRGQGHLSSIINNWEAALDFVISPPPAEIAALRDNMASNKDSSKPNKENSAVTPKSS
jgi:pimeloyl-ACP methyl ester carboxylesterase